MRVRILSFKIVMDRGCGEQGEAVQDVTRDSNGLTVFRSTARGLHMPAELRREHAKHEARKRRPSVRPRVGCCEELAGGFADVFLPLAGDFVCHANQLCSRKSWWCTKISHLRRQGGQKGYKLRVLDLLTMDKRQLQGVRASVVMCG
jgi:hypothetical protein